MGGRYFLVPVSSRGKKHCGHLHGSQVAKLDALQQKTHTSEGAPHQQSVHVCPKARDKITGEESRHLLQLSPGYLAEKLKDPQHAALVLFVTDW